MSNTQQVIADINLMGSGDGALILGTRVRSGPASLIGRTVEVPLNKDDIAGVLVEIAGMPCAARVWQWIADALRELEAAGLTLEDHTPAALGETPGEHLRASILALMTEKEGNAE